MTDVVVDTLRLRGAHGRRLARVAARALPAALERALADVGDVEVSSVRVVLDLDPEEYDDDTLAVLWADLVRAEVLARRGTSATIAAPVAGGVSARSEPAGAGNAPAAARSWLATPSAQRGRVPAALLALGDRAEAARVAVALGAVEWEQLLAALREVVWSFAGTGDRARGEDPQTGPPTRLSAEGAPPGAGRAGTPAGADRPDPAPAFATVEDAAAAVDAASDVLTVLDTLRDLRLDRTEPVAPAAVTRVAGLVLLYPWLADHCRAAEELHPGVDQYDVREAALAALVDDPTAVDDPLVRILAGRVEEPEPRERLPLPRQDDVDASAERVLASFAGLLPGFERSTPGFVRDAWLVRLGVLDRDRSPVQLSAATHPLDVLLPQLPYPLGLLKLPWSTTLTVRFRP